MDCIDHLDTVKELLSPSLFPNATAVRFEFVPYTWPPSADVHMVHPLVRMYVPCAICGASAPIEVRL